MAYFFKKNLCYTNPALIVSVTAQVCLITQETKIQKSGHQQPVHQEPRGSVLAVGQLTCPFPGTLCWVNRLPFTSFTAGPALVKALPHLLTSCPSLLQPSPWGQQLICLAFGGTSVCLSSGGLMGVFQKRLFCMICHRICSNKSFFYHVATTGKKKGENAQWSNYISY